MLALQLLGFALACCGSWVLGSRWASNRGRKMWFEAGRAAGLEKRKDNLNEVLYNLSR